MHHQGVKSTLLQSIAHEGDVLEVRFANGGKLYRYSGVSPEVFAALRDSPSIGKCFSETIRGRYVHELVTEEKSE